MAGAHDPATRAGWHLLEIDAPADLPAQATAWLACRDAAGGESRLPIGPRPASGQWTRVIVVPEGLRPVALQGGPHAEPMPASAWRLKPIGRVAALARMLADRGGTPPPPDPDAEVGGSPGGALRALGERVLADYRRRHGMEDEPGVPRAGVRVRTGRVGREYAASWRPLQQTSAQVVDGVREWTLHGTDAQWLLERRGVPIALPAGWYLFECEARASAGRLVAPALYPDFGEGCLAHEMLPLPEPDARGRIRAVVMLGATARQLRFDPGTAPARFTFRDCRLRHLGRPAALAELLRAAGPSALPDFVRHARRHGLSAAASRLNGREAAPLAWDEYTQWTRLFDTIGPADLARLRERAQALGDGPRFSILVPVYETDERWLRRCLDSVLAQAYDRWELCLADDASPSPHVAKVLAEYARRDPRIRVQRREANGHIAAASNTALAMATGDFVAFLDHDDELRPHSLLRLAEAIAADPQAALLYSDEDKIDADGRRFLPYFKPDWNPDLLLAQNYLCHFTAIRTDLVRAVGGFREGYEGSQDHDLFLRVTEQLPAARIRHVPGVLYHWRAIEGSTAYARSAKDYAAAAGLRAVASHLERTQVAGAVEELAHGHYRVRFALPQPAPRVAIIVPTRDRAHLLRTCIDSLLALTRYDDFEVLVVDNQTAEPEALALLGELRGRDRVRVLAWDAPFNYSALNNWAVAQTDAPVLCLLNNDIEVIDGDWLAELVSWAARPGIGAVGAKLLYPDGRLQHAGVILGLGGVANHIYTGCPDGVPGHGARALVAQDLSAVTGACLAVKRETYLAVGGLDERLTVAFNDIDFCLRLGEAGLRNAWTPFARLVHHESATRGRDDDGPRRARFEAEVDFMQARWGDRLRHDPAWNPNLSLDDLTAALAFPPRGQETA